MSSLFKSTLLLGLSWLQEELYKQRHATKTLTSIAVRLKQFLVGL